ncbi:preprotein translocase subunit SecE [Clostridium vitabionis]|jgi:preprotein translocase subunit SecE|uniref:preprotein translocase subunit SecE n=1 Tax=Clostridium vitabionis TaxID=2784388 RepID=UPI00188C8A80|nr:preprotein translocase subunit SecE [Clostridium vitabionis]
MADTEKNQKSAKKTSYWKGLKSEFNKIVWPDQETVAKETGSVVAASIALGLIIAGLDTLLVFLLHYVI